MSTWQQNNEYYNFQTNILLPGDRYSCSDPHYNQTGVNNSATAYIPYGVFLQRFTDVDPAITKNAGAGYNVPLVSPATATATAQTICGISLRRKRGMKEGVINATDLDLYAAQAPAFSAYRPKGTVTYTSRSVYGIGVYALNIGGYTEGAPVTISTTAGSQGFITNGAGLLLPNTTLIKAPTAWAGNFTGVGLAGAGIAIVAVNF
jgi:hypothetical protein